MRVKVARDPALHRAARSKVESRRPQCPECGRRMPHPGEAREYFLEPWGHRRPIDQEPCPGFRKGPTMAPPPPLPAPARPAPRPVVERMTVAEWSAWFAQARAAAPRPVRVRRVRRERPAPQARQVTSSSQLVLFTPDGRVWCELQQAGLWLVGENNQGERQAGDDQGETLAVVARGAECGRG